MKKKITFFAFSLVIYSLFSITNIKAQEYKYEIGGMAGVSFYMGDANKTKLYRNPGPAGGVVFRYNKDFRWAFKSNLVIGHVSGDTKKSGDAFPYAQQSSFNRMFYELGGQIEFNFFNYSDKFAYLDTKRFTPYVFTGVGVTYGSGEKKFFNANIPLGIGVKYKLKERLNIGFEFSFRRLFGDDFDVTKKNQEWDLDDPLYIKSSFTKNKDWYSLTMFSITWDFGFRCNPCFND